MPAARRARYADAAAVNTFAGRLLERTRTLPGVHFAGITSNIPFGGDYSDSVILAEGYQMKPGESLISPYRILVTPINHPACTGIRVMPNVYTTLEEIDTFCEAMEGIIRNGLPVSKA